MDNKEMKENSFLSEQNMDYVIQRLEEIPALRSESQMWHDAWADMQAYAQEKNREIIALTAELDFYHTYFNERTKKILRPFFRIYQLLRKVKNKIQSVGKSQEQSAEDEKVEQTELIPVDEKIYVTLTPDINPYIRLDDIDTTVSVVIPTCNGGSDIANLLGKLHRQVGCTIKQIIVVDSQSDDDTVERCRFLGATVIEIKKEEFSHSYARNLGAREATGDTILFMTQDALPEDEYWLYKMLYVMKKNNVVAVSPMERESKKGDLKYKIDSWSHIRSLELLNEDRICERLENASYVKIRKNAQLTDTACLIRKEIFDAYGYRDDYAEDLDLGVRLITDGKKIALLSSVRTVHSHNRAAGYYMRRFIVDNQAMHRILPDVPIVKRDAQQLRQDLRNNFYIVMSIIAQIEEIDISEMSVLEFCQTIQQIVKAGNWQKQTQDRYGDDTFIHCLRELGIETSNDIYVKKTVTLSADIQNFFDHCLGLYLITRYNTLPKEIKAQTCDAIYKTYATYVGTVLGEYNITSEQDDEITNMINRISEGI